MFVATKSRFAQEKTVGLGYDIFRGLENGEVVWVNCAESLDDAKSQIVALVTTRPGRYFVRSASTGEIITSFDRDSLGEACA
jgi:hypothetical protein